MTTRRTTAVRLLAVLAAGTLLASGPAQAATPAAPASHEAPAAPQAPGVPVLAGRTLTLAAGRHRTLPFPASHRHALFLLGRSGSSWVVEDHTSNIAKIYTVKGQHKTLVHRDDDSEYSTTFRLAYNGKRILQVDVGRGDSSRATVFGIGGKIIAHHTWGTYAQILDFTGAEAVIETRHPFVWHIGSAPVSISTSAAAAAAIRHDLLFLDEAADDANGPTSLSDPGTPSYYRLFDPEVVSPDGTEVLGEGQDGMSVEVHRVSDGDLLAQTILGNSDDHALTWADDDDYLIVTRDGGKELVLSCSVTSAECVKTGAGGPVALPVTVGFSNQV